MFTRRRVTSENHLLLPILVLCGLIASCAPTLVPKPLVAKPVTGPSVKAQKPEWEVGYRWEYAWKRPESSGTTTEEVIRESTFEGVPCYVIKRGRREYFYTKAVLGYIASKSKGNFTQVNPDPTLCHQGIVGDEHQLSPSVARNESGGLMWTAACQMF